MCVHTIASEHAKDETSVSYSSINIRSNDAVESDVSLGYVRVVERIHQIMDTLLFEYVWAFLGSCSLVCYKNRTRDGGKIRVSDSSPHFLRYSSQTRITLIPSSDDGFTRQDRTISEFNLQ